MAFGVFHAVGMDQIKAARHALDNLTTDEVELSRLEADHRAQIDKLKASGSRDFAALAELEGKRAALASMLSEQRQAISEARAELGRLEAQSHREQLISRVGHLAAGIEADRATLDAALRQLLSHGGALLLTIVDAHEQWMLKRKQWLRLAGELKFNLEEQELWKVAESELAAHGVKVELLPLVRLQWRADPSERADPWPVPTVIEPKDDLAARLHVLLQGAAIEAIRNGEHLREQALSSEERGGGYDTGLLSHLPSKAPGAAGYVDPLTAQGQK